MNVSAKHPCILKMASPASFHPAILYSYKNFPSLSLELNMCIPNPCKNGGQCLGYEGGHKCICLPGYKGENCDGEIFLFICLINYIISGIKSFLVRSLKNSKPSKANLINNNF